MCYKRAPADVPVGRSVQSVQSVHALQSKDPTRWFLVFTAELQRLLQLRSSSHPEGWTEGSHYNFQAATFSSALFSFCNTRRLLSSPTQICPQGPRFALFLTDDMFLSIDETLVHLISSPSCTAWLTPLCHACKKIKDKALSCC